MSWRVRLYFRIKRFAGVKECEHVPKWLKLVRSLLLWYNSPCADIKYEHNTDTLKIFGYRYSLVFFAHIADVKLNHPFEIIYRNEKDGYFTVVDSVTSIVTPGIQITESTPYHILLCRKRQYDLE